MKKEFRIDNFIATFDNYILDHECDKAIELYESQKKLNNVFTRVQSENTSGHLKKDSQFFVDSSNVEVWYKSLKALIVNFDIALKQYESQTNIKEVLNVDSLLYTSLKIQKTLPGQGYHIWHTEKSYGFDINNRVLAYTIYLNDIEEGGETEFLHHSIRVKPKKGRIAIWPAAFPYVHRGNPPLKGEKYILTSWMMLPRDI